MSAAVRDGGAARGVAAPPPCAGRWAGALYRGYAAAAGVVRSSAAVHRALFGHWPHPTLEGQLWDWTTLALKGALRRHATPGASLLDMGTGPAGVLAIYARRRLGCGRVCGVDHAPELLRSAALSAARCGADVTFRWSALFSQVRERYDLIAFNAPYIPVAHGRRLGALRTAEAERRWGGGASGLETVERFLAEAPAHLTPHGLALLGVNHFYVRPAAVRRLAAAAGLELVESAANPVTLAGVYVARPRP